MFIDLFICLFIYSCVYLFISISSQRIEDRFKEPEEEEKPEEVVKLGDSQVVAVLLQCCCSVGAV